MVLGPLWVYQQDDRSVEAVGRAGAAWDIGLRTRIAGQIVVTCYLLVALRNRRLQVRILRGAIPQTLISLSRLGFSTLRVPTFVARLTALGLFWVCQEGLLDHIVGLVIFSTQSEAILLFGQWVALPSGQKLAFRSSRESLSSDNLAVFNR